jgi:hypothetical protein
LTRGEPEIKQTAALLYILTGIVVTWSYLVITGAMLGMALPIFSLESTLIRGLCGIGPSMLVLVGLTTAFPASRRSPLCFLVAGVILVLLSLGTVSRIGWPYASRLFLVPEALSLFVAAILVVWIKKRWISAALASALSASLFVYGSVSLAYGAIARGSRPTSASVWIFVPALLAILAFATAARFRID